MKKFVLSCLLGSFLFRVDAQESLIIQPSPETGIDAPVNSRTDLFDNNYADSPNLQLHGGTGFNVGSDEQDVRSFLKLSELDNIPDNAVIDSAKLVLYSNFDGEFNTPNGDNASKIYAVTEDWDEATITWNNQPAFDANSGVRVNNMLTNFDSVVVNITSLVKEIVEYNAPNYGFILKLDSEDPYRNLVFGSSDYSVETKRPKWMIYYTLPSACKTFRPDAIEGIDAQVNSRTDLFDNNYGDVPSLQMHGGTGFNVGSDEQDVRSFLKLSALSSLPENIIIDSAKITLFSNTDSEFYVSNGENASQMYLVSEDWDEHTITWNNQPAFDANTGVRVNNTLGSFDSVVVDITSLVEAVVMDMEPNYGFMLKLDSEDPYRNLVFSSSDVAEVTMRPYWEVCYTVNNVITDVVDFKFQNALVSPNPSRGTFNFTEVSSGKVMDMSGRLKSEFSDASSINLGHLEKGVYIIIFENGKSGKIVLQ